MRRGQYPDERPADVFGLALGRRESGGTSQPEENQTACIEAKLFLSPSASSSEGNSLRSALDFLRAVLERRMTMKEAARVRVQTHIRRDTHPKYARRAAHRISGKLLVRYSCWMHPVT